MSTSSDALEKIVAELEQAISLRRGHKALGLARLLRKHPAYSAEHRQLVARAYETRLDEMLAAGQTREAEELRRMLAETQPQVSAGLSSETTLRAEIFGTSGVLLARYGTDAALTAAADGIIRRECRDLRVLAENQNLPENHRLRSEAASIIRAWREIEEGKEGDGVRAMLASVGRRSPLVGWRLFVQALAAFYGRRDDEARVCLAKISDDDCVIRLSSIIKRMLSGAAPEGGHERAVHAAVFGGSIRHYLSEIDTLLDRGRLLEARRRMSELSSRPVWQGKTGLLKEVMSRLFVKTGAFQNEETWDDFDLPPPRVRMNALEFESDVRCKFMRGMDLSHDWERLMQVAQPPFGGLEKALVYDRMASLEIDLGEIRLPGGENAPELDLPDEREAYESAREYWKKSVEQHPLPEVYRFWERQARLYSLGEAASVLERWRSDFPNDEQPLLGLISISRERRNAGKTVEYFDALDRIARGRPDVEALRYFVRLDSVARHLGEGNAALAAGELEAMTGPAPSFEEALRSTLAMICALDSGDSVAEALERIRALRRPETVLFALSIMQKLCSRFDIQAPLRVVLPAIEEQTRDYDLMAGNYPDLLLSRDAVWGMREFIFCNDPMLEAFKFTALPSGRLRSIVDGIAERDRLFRAPLTARMAWALTGNGIARSDSETYAFLAYRALLYAGAPDREKKINLVLAYQRMLDSLAAAYKLARKTGRNDAPHFVEVIADLTPVYDRYAREAGSLSEKRTEHIISEEGRVCAYEDLPSSLRSKGPSEREFLGRFRRRKKRRARAKAGVNQPELF